jgi:hypothetical protein
VGCSTTSPDLWIESVRSGFCTLSQRPTSEDYLEVKGVKVRGTSWRNSSARILNLIAKSDSHFPRTSFQRKACLRCCTKKILETRVDPEARITTLYPSATGDLRFSA